MSSVGLIKHIKLKKQKEDCGFVFPEMEGTLTFQMRRIHNAMFKVANRLMQEEALPLKAEQLPVLMVVYSSKGISQQEIAAAVYRDKSSVMRTINMMEQKGWVMVTANQFDKRRNEISVTETGKFLARQVMNILHKAEDELFSAFDQNDKQEAITLMRQTADKIEKIQTK